LSPVYIERNLYIQNSLSFRVTRFCLKKTGPGEVILIRIMVIKKTGEKRMSKNKELKISKRRLKILNSILFFIFLENIFDIFWF
jgi:hypothetical protein